MKRRGALDGEGSYRSIRNHHCGGSHSGGLHFNIGAMPVQIHAGRTNNVGETVRTEQRAVQDTVT
ncbi:hypothetical protein [Pandoraea apista]|uniref:hypothetical protein n=1 Tax=Pandoraea apista TaxID=93218 RepID=UPI000F669902|nr:hypothetical protein [Pandoraea apista]